MERVSFYWYNCASWYNSNVYRASKATAPTTTTNLTGNREDWLRWLGDTGRDGRHDHVDHDGQQGGQGRSECVLDTAVLWHLNEFVDGPTNQVHPAHRRSEAEARNDGVEGLGFEFLGHKVDSLKSRVHGEFYTIRLENNLLWK